MFSFVSILLIVTILCSLTMLYAALSVTYTRAERLSIVVSLTLAFWMITAYLALLVVNIIPVAIISLSWFIIALVVLLHNNQPVSSIYYNITQIKVKEIPTNFLEKAKHFGSPSLLTILFLLSTLVLILISFQPLVPIDPEFTWFDPYGGPIDFEEIRQFSFLSLIQIPQIIGFAIVFVFFIGAILRESKREYIALMFFIMCIILVIGPIFLIGRPWGIDSYAVGNFVRMYEVGDYGINEIYFAGYLDSLLHLFLKDVLGVGVLETVMILIPLFHSQIFLGLWILFSRQGIETNQSKLLLLLVAFTPSLLQYARIGSTLLSGVFFMLMTVWFIEKRGVKLTETSENSNRDWWPAIVFAGLTAVHQVTALALIIYLVLRPVVGILKMDTRIDNRSLSVLLSVYLALEGSQFFEWRVTPMLSEIGIGGPLFSPLVNTTIGQRTLLIRPIYGIAIVGGYFLLLLIARMISKRQISVTREKIGVLLYKSSLVVGLVVGMLLSIIMLTNVSLIAGIELIVASRNEMIMFYSVYIFMALFIPYSMIKLDSRKGFFILFYVFAHIAAVLPEILFNFVGGGVAIRLVITIPVILGFVNSQNTKDLDLTTKTGIALVIVLATLILSGIAGSLILHYIL